MRKKLLALSLTLVFCCMINFMSGCATTEDKVGTLTATSTSTAFTVGQDRDTALSTFTFTYVPAAGEKQSVWNSTTQTWEQKEMVASDYASLTYQQALKLGLLVTGYNVDSATGTNEKRKLKFTLFGAECTVDYTVTESAS